MEFRIADIFTDSLSKLNNDEQKAVKTTAFDLQINPANPGMQFHKLDKTRDTNFWSVRVSRDIRIIVHKSKSSLLLCFVAHHDDAYHWAERRKMETHPKTGAAQIVEIRETIQEIAIPQYIEVEESKPLLFTLISDEELLNYGVPQEWLEDVRKANEDTVLELADHLPGEAAEALLDLAVGVTPHIYKPEEVVDPFDHPDAQRRFRVMNNVEELERALNFPWEKWTVFLHPAQTQLVEKQFSGPSRVSGSAGTGKTIVALHRAVYLAKNNPDTRVLITTFSDTLANVLNIKLRRLISSEPRLGERLEIHSINNIGLRLYELNFGQVNIINPEDIRNLIIEISDKVDDLNFSKHFLFTEWEQVIDAWQLETWDEYKNVKRLGRKTRLPENRREKLWFLYQQVISEIKSRVMITYAGLFNKLQSKYSESKDSPFEYVIVDEAQDISVAQLKFLSSLSYHPDSLFFAGDLGQRIFQQPFSWLSLGIDIRSRSESLKINYRTSHQIRMQADRLLGPEIADVDGIVEDRRGTISVFNGPNPTIETFSNEELEIESVNKWLGEKIAEGLELHEIGIFVRSASELERAISAIEKTKLNYQILDENISTIPDHIHVCTMHLAKGLEFRAVAIMACDDEVIPSQARIETVTDDTDLEEVYNTERHLLYVACTRARDHLLLTGVKPGSEFLDDLQL